MKPRKLESLTLATLRSMQAYVRATLEHCVATGEPECTRKAHRDYLLELEAAIQKRTGTATEMQALTDEPVAE